jgi:hypothetical protein
MAPDKSTKSDGPASARQAKPPTNHKKQQINAANFTSAD